ncbi:hypothetical protein C2E21_1364 [Chlorella sorokiniana]|uniref:Uncharacterized protein n=1 Tax=Chlorella sorokiniana TaxID=3076 RepID=A0A2P6TZL6_CHLSO|nr:hypothetical protein C2E21_1364 [Chlorella sorokiniana]|eukprot:PRW59507.1 hypothetical protein C2E21_1364 [Chlorella sorokiniana]
MGSSGSRSPHKGSAQELSTPEALRREASASRLDRAGDEQPQQPKGRHAAAKLRARARRCGRALVFVPWVALVALALLVAGLAVFTIKSTAASSAATDLLNYVGSAESGQGFPAYLKTWKSSIFVTTGVAGACSALLAVVAAVRLDQRLRKAGKYSSSKGAYGELLYKFWCFLAYLGLVAMLLLALWAVVNVALLSAWAAQTHNLDEGAAAANAHIAQLSDMGTSLKQAVGEFAGALQTAVDAAAATEAQAVSATAAAASATAAAAAAKAAAAAAQAKDAPKKQQKVKETLTIKNVAPAPAPAAAAEAAADQSASASDKIEEAIVPLATALQGFANNISEVTIPTVRQDGGLCPSAACFNLAYYPFTESTYCMCTAVGTQTTADLASTASDAARWALIGAAALCAGAVIGTMELGASAALLQADQAYLKVAKRRSSRSSSGRGSASRRDSRHSSYSDMAQLGLQGLAHKSMSPGIVLQARG